MTSLKQTSYIIALVHPNDNYDDGVMYTSHCISVGHGFKGGMAFYEVACCVNSTGLPDN